MDLIARAMASKPKSEDFVYVEKVSATRFYVWYKQPNNKWMRWHIFHSVVAGHYVDVWRIEDFQIGDINAREPMQGGLALINTCLPCATLTQWEYAIQPNGAPDFMGGYHGDEYVQEIIFLANGKTFDLSAMTIGTVQKFNKFEMCQTTFLNSPSDHTTKLAEMYVRHIFTPDGLDLIGKAKWVASITVDIAYGAMLPLKRAATNGVQYSRFLEMPTITDISSAGHSKPSLNTYGIELWNSGDNFSALLEYTDMSYFNDFAKTNSKAIWVTDSANYNKVYTNRAVYPQTETVVSGNVWNYGVKYRFYLPS